MDKSGETILLCSCAWEHDALCDFLMEDMQLDDMLFRLGKNGDPFVITIIPRFDLEPLFRFMKETKLEFSPIVSSLDKIPTWE